MARPRHCSNPGCDFARSPPAHWCIRAEFYHTLAHGVVQRYQCRRCGKRLSEQTESLYYFSERRLGLDEILSRVPGGESLRDIGRELGCSRTAVAPSLRRPLTEYLVAHS